MQNIFLNAPISDSFHIIPVSSYIQVQIIVYSVCPIIDIVLK